MITTQSLAESIDLAKQGSQSMTRCLAHEDGNASLHVAPGKSQPVVMMCHARCDTQDILTAAGLDFQILLGERAEDETEAGNQSVWTPAGPASHVYPYTDEDGTLLYEVLRIPTAGGGKTFRQRQPDTTKPHGWNWSMEGARRVLYRLPEVLSAKIAGDVIYVVEGEKDVETLRRHGETATTSPMGAGKWQESYTQLLAGANVVIIPDADATGRAHARAVRESLVAAGCNVALKETMTGTKDISEHFSAGGDIASLLETVPEGEESRETYGADILEVITRTIKPESFVIPNVLAKGDRLLLTAFEGHGKSTLMRQLAIMAAAGIHPWDGTPIPAKRVVVIDSENHPDQVLGSWQEMVGLARANGYDIDPGQLIIIEAWDADLDLTTSEGHAWLMERVHAYRPDLMCIGPLYNLTAGDLKDPGPATLMKKAVNDARGICGTAFIMEHHAPHRSATDTKRSVRPYGHTVLLRWPDFGYGLNPTDEEGVYEWQKTRMPRVRTRYFPEFMRWGKANTREFPWMTASQDAEGKYF